MSSSFTVGDEIMLHTWRRLHVCQNQSR